MPVIVRRGIVRAGRVVVEGVSSRILRGKGGWFLVSEPSGMPPSRVRYFQFRDRATIATNGETIVFRFRRGGAMVGWRGRAYRLHDMSGGRIRMTQDDREVVTGRVTPSGVRLDVVAPELLPIVRSLALVLALHSEDLSRVGGLGSA